MKVHSLHSKFMLLFFLFFFVPYGLLTLFSVYMSKGMMKKSTMDHLQNLVEIKETAIEQWLKERILDGKTIAESQEIRSLDPKRIKPFLSLIKQVDPAYIELWVLNVKGQIVSGNLSHASFAEEKWFQRALEDGTFILSPTLQPDSRQSAITVSILLKDAQDRPAGVLKALVSLTYVSELIAESQLGETGEFFIVNPQGEFALFKKSGELLKQGISRVPYFDKIPPRPTTTGVYTDYTGNEVLGSWKWIPSLRCYLIAEQDTKESFLEIALLVKKAFIIFLVSTFFILGISYWVVVRVTGPIKHLSEAVTSFADGHFSKTVSTRRKDEIGTLITGFNLMAEKLNTAYTALEGKVEASNKELESAYQLLKQRQEQLIQSGKMAALGQLSAGIAHEIRTPLTSIKIFIQSLEKEIDSDEHQKEDFRIIKKEIDRMNEIISRFLHFARPEDPLLQAIRISPLVKETVNLLAARLKSNDIQVDLFLADEGAPLEGDPKQLTQVFLNLFLNAIEAMPHGGTLTIRSAVKTDPDSRQDFLQVIVKDTGHGVPAKERAHLFDPFFTTKTGGTGLGLSIVYSIIQKHNGRIEVESEMGKGSAFILWLPIGKEGAWGQSLL
jgi:two-component system, NtrC family, sensor kinase